MAKDVVCGMEVNEKTAKYKSDYRGKTYYFCNQFCKESFDTDPTKYLGAETKQYGRGGHSSCCCS